MGKARWTQALEKRLHDLWYAGLPPADIAAALNREFGTAFTASGVSTKASRMRLPSRVKLRRNGEIPVAPRRDHGNPPSGRRGEAMRTCIICRHLFLSSGPGHRICDFCRRNADDLHGTPYILHL